MHRTANGSGRFPSVAVRNPSAPPFRPRPARIGGRNLPGTVVAENRQIHIPDLDDLDPDMADWPGLPPARAAGARVMCGTPLRRGGKAIGVLILHRDQPVPFTDDELALQQSFADQAVIAIENARLFNQTQETLARQTATADILRVISQSPTDVQPVFYAIVRTAVQLLGCDMVRPVAPRWRHLSPAAAASTGGPCTEHHRCESADRSRGQLSVARDRRKQDAASAGLFAHRATRT